MRIRHLLHKIFGVAGVLLATSSFAQTPVSQSTDPVAESMLLYQRAVGGWPKHIGEQRIDYRKPLSEGERAGLNDDKFRNDATIDNDATNKEIRYLVKAYQSTGNRAYLDGAVKGINYLLRMQYPSGGFPQFYPDTSLYRSEITYNDNAMVNALTVLWDLAHGTAGFEVVNDAALREEAAKAVERGINCMLKTQIRVKGKLTAWCAQYDYKTFQPAKARAFELVSLSGSESVGIVRFLMKVEKPSPEIINAVKNAVAWFEASRLTGFRVADVKDASLPKGYDRVLVPDSSAVLWARFYDIDTNKPFFCGRDGVKKWNVSEVEYERRTGYAWYGTWPADLLQKEYPEWKKKNHVL